MAGRVSGLAVFYATAGGVLLWSGIKGQTIAQTVRAVASGSQGMLAAQGPETIGTPVLTNSTVGETANGSPLVGTVTPGSKTAQGNTTAGAAANRALGRVLAAAYGWTGQDWTALDYGWGTLESSWNNDATNPSSGAFGIAQAYGHGTPQTQGTIPVNGSVRNEYGPIGANWLGMSAGQMVSANNGNAYAQIIWGLAYIKATYGHPSAIPGWTGGSGYAGY